MKTRVHTWMVAVSVMLLAPGLYGDVSVPEGVGIVVAIQGKAVIHRANQPEITVQLKTPVHQGDRMVTGADGKLQVMFQDETILAQGPDSEVTIDEYVYSPGQRDVGRCRLSMAKGIFRTITGRITEMNPERFNVKTRMATIGIRGCDTGFRLEQQTEQILSIWLPPGHSLEITPDNPPPGGTQPIPTQVQQGGSLVTLDGAGGTEQRQADGGDVQGMINDTTPQLGGDGDGDPAAGGGGTGGGGDGGTEPGGAGAGGAAGAEPGQGEGEGLSGAVAGDDLMAMDGFTDPTVDDPVAGDDAGLTDPMVAVQLSGDLSVGTVEGEDLFVDPTPETEPVSGPVSEPETILDPVSEPDPVVPGGTLTYYTQASGINWEWGYWMDENGYIAESDSFNYQPLGGPGLDNIIAQGTTYMLGGIGPAGAIIDANGTQVLPPLLGDVYFNMSIGGGYNEWSADFAMDNGAAGSMLAFVASGFFLGSTGLELTGVSGYAFDFEGTPMSTYDSLLLWGSLVGPGLPESLPITGVVGWFDVQHGNIFIAGEYGANLPPGSVNRSLP